VNRKFILFFRIQKIISGWELANGLSRFDGKKFENFTSGDNLATGGVISITEDSLDISGLDIGVEEVYQGTMVINLNR